MKENVFASRARCCFLAVAATLALGFAMLFAGVTLTPCQAYASDILPVLCVGSWSLQGDGATPTVPGVSYDGASNTVTLNNVEITTDNTMSGAIYYVDYTSQARELTIKLVGTNKIHLHHHAAAAIGFGGYNARSSLKITGGGSLAVDGGKGALLFNKGTGGSVTIDGANLSADTAGMALNSAALTIKNSTIGITSKISDADGFYGLDYASRLSIQNSRLEIKNTSGTAALFSTLVSGFALEGIRAYTGNGRAEYSLAAADLAPWFYGSYLLFTDEDLGLPACIVGDPDITFKPSSLKYNGKAQRPKVSVTVKGKAVAASNYEVKWDDGGKTVGAVGAHSATVTLKGAYVGKGSASYKVVKGVNPLTVKAKTASVAYSKLKDKNQTLKVSKVLAVSKNAGKVTYAKKSGDKKILVNKKTGAVTLKKGLKKGAYKVKVAVTAKGNANYKKGTKTVTFKVKVK